MIKDYLKTSLQYVVPQTLLSRLAGSLASSEISWIKDPFIRHFIKHYDVDMSQAIEPDPANFACFNDFFIRRLKPECRPLDDDPRAIVSPVDGQISQLGTIDNGRIFQAKGQDYSLYELLGVEIEQASDFLNGRFATLYLSPKDYHRIHMPIDASLKEMLYMPGRLFSVQPATVNTVPHLFARNERLVVFFDTPCGPMVMVLVGAMIVASMHAVWQGDIAREKEPRHWCYPNARCNDVALKKGDEMGHFKLGSTVILLFADSQHCQWEDELSAGDGVRYGQRIASIPMVD